MPQEMEHEVHLHMESKGLVGELKEATVLSSIPKSLLPNTSRPNSMVVKKVCPREFIPPHIVAEAMSTLHGLDLRWSGPITPTERGYVEQYVLAKYPQYSHGLIQDVSDKNDLFSTYYSAAPGSSPAGSPGSSSSSSAAAAVGEGAGGMEAVRLEASRLLDIMAEKASFPGSFVSIPEIQARNRVLRHCGLTDDEYLVLFAPTPKDALMLVGESYPFFRSKYYMSILDEASDCVREFAAYKEAKVIAAPESWLDLRIKGSQLSQYFRRKCKHAPKGLFAYPAAATARDGGGGGARYSLHWVSEAHRNSWHVLLDATAPLAADHRLGLSLHRPDFVLCTTTDARAQQPAPPTITCLLVRKRSFDTSQPHQH